MRAINAILALMLFAGFVCSADELALDVGNDTGTDWTGDVSGPWPERLNLTEEVKRYVRGGCWCEGCVENPVTKSCCVPIVLSADIKGNLTINDADFAYRKSTVLAEVGYGESFRRNRGACWEVQHLGGITSPVPVPQSYSGGVCMLPDYTYSTGFDPTSVEATTDASIDAMYRLLNGTLDAGGDGEIDLLYNDENMSFNVESSLGVQSMWGPMKVRLVVWA